MAQRGTRGLTGGAGRFLRRRLDYAILEQRMPSAMGPIRTQGLSLLAGCGLAAVCLVAAGGTAALRPPSGPGGAALVMSRQSGTLFVRVDARLRPVSDLASARLILGSPATPTPVDEAQLGDVERGPVLGIPGAPRGLVVPLARDTLRWTVCDETDGTTTVLAVPLGALQPLPPNSAVIVSARGATGDRYLLYDGRRAAVDPDDPVIARVLAPTAATVRPVSAAFLNAIPEAPAIAAPRVAGAGEHSAVTGYVVGSVLRVDRAGGSEFYVVLRNGLQRVGALAVDLIRFAGPATASGILTVAPDVIAGSPLADELPTAALPDAAPAVIEPGERLCATWTPGGTAISSGPGASAVPAVVGLATSDGDGPAIDRFWLPPGHGADVSVSTVGARPGTRYLITDAGVRFPLADSAAAAALGLADAPEPAPWGVIGALPAGPELSRPAALIARDVPGGPVAPEPP